MMCYKDKTFCSCYLLCKTWQYSGCHRAATPEIIKAAEKWSKPITKDGTILMSLYNSFPECFVRWFE